MSLLLFESSSAPISNQNNLIAAELNLHFREKRLLATPLVFEFLFSEMHQEQKLNIFSSVGSISWEKKALLIHFD